jgi:hypothetical protein
MLKSQVAKKVIPLFQKSLLFDVLQPLVSKTAMIFLQEGPIGGHRVAFYADAFLIQSQIVLLKHLMNHPSAKNITRKY